MKEKYDKTGNRLGVTLTEKDSLVRFSSLSTDLLNEQLSQIHEAYEKLKKMANEVENLAHKNSDLELRIGDLENERSIYLSFAI